jgi:hypothetical protein
MAQPIPTWEYRIESDLTVNALDEIGRQGWELVETGENRYVFKRPALSFVERVTLEQRAHVYATLGLDPDASR